MKMWFRKTVGWAAFVICMLIGIALIVAVIYLSVSVVGANLAKLILIDSLLVVLAFIFVIIGLGALESAKIDITLEREVEKLEEEVELLECRESNSKDKNE